MGKAVALAAAALMATVLAACSIPTMHFADPAPAPVTTTSIFVSSLRGEAAPGSDMVTRANMLTYSVHTVSVPPQRPPGKVSPNGLGNNPAKEFIDLGGTRFVDEDTMITALSAKASAIGAPGEVMIFVHGFNNSFDHGLKRIVEIDTDYHAPIAKLLFDWPTDRQLLNYANDLDSAVFSRDGLEHVVEGLADHGFKRIVLVGYSMGAKIIMEAMRQMRIGGEDKALARIGGVVMIAPDIDVDVFAQDARRIAPLPEPFIVLSSPNDWPLRELQRFVYAGRQRLGTITDFTPVETLPITVITAPTSGDPAEALHLATTSLSLINAANAVNADLAEFAPFAAAVPGATVETHGSTVKIALP